MYKFHELCGEIECRKRTGFNRSWPYLKRVQKLTQWLSSILAILVLLVFHYQNYTKKELVRALIWISTKVCQVYPLSLGQSANDRDFELCSLNRVIKSEKWVVACELSKLWAWYFFRSSLVTLKFSLASCSIVSLPKTNSLLPACHIKLWSLPDKSLRIDCDVIPFVFYLCLLVS